jgi:hypothetical protein
MLTLFIAFLICASPINGAIPFSSKDQGVAFQEYRIASLAVSGGADLGECFAVMEKVGENDDESWFKEWMRMANKLEGEAAASFAKGQFQSATSAYFRAASYYKAAQISLRGNRREKRVIETWQKFKDCFSKAVQGLTTPLIAIKIPFENRQLNGFLCLPDTDTTPRPLLILQTGLDGSAEELFWMFGKAAVERGYVCLIVEGPGQGSLVLEQKIPMRPNWETVVTPIVDFAYELPWVNTEKIAILGTGFAGYLVPRALAFEKRIQAGIVTSGIFDFPALFFGSELSDGVLTSKAQKEDLDQQIFSQMKECQSIRWTYENAMLCFGAAAPSELIEKLKPYTLKNYAQLIGARLLVVDSEYDARTHGQSKALYNALICPKDYMLFSADEGAGCRCQVGAQLLANEKIFNWLDMVFKKRQ